MKLKALCTSTLLAFGSIGIAYATPNLVANADFGSTSRTLSGPTQFGIHHGTAGSPSCGWGGQVVSGWTGNGGYGIWYPSATAASTSSACTQYGNANTQRLPSAVTAPPVGSGSFIGLDGQSGLNFGVSQMVDGLTAGNQYTVDFYWAQTQEMSRTGATYDLLQVALGSTALNVPVNVCGINADYAAQYTCQSTPTGWDGQYFQTTPQHIDTHGWTGWMAQSYTFTASASSAFLSFLSIGTPGSLPPFAVLTGVSMAPTNDVPEPPELALFGGGLLGLGLLTVSARRRALRSRNVGAA